jgi:hypothetical protein
MAPKEATRNGDNYTRRSSFSNFILWHYENKIKEAEMEHSR